MQRVSWPVGSVWMGADANGWYHLFFTHMGAET